MANRLAAVASCLFCLPASFLFPLPLFVGLSALFVCLFLVSHQQNRKTVNTPSINCTQHRVVLNPLCCCHSRIYCTVSLLHAAVEFAVRTADKQSRPVVGAGCVDRLQLDVLAPAKPQKAAAAATAAGGNY